MSGRNESGNLSAEQVLRRYKDEDLPAFCEIPLTDVNQVGNFGERPLHIACSRGFMGEVVALVNAGADVNAPGELSNTPLHESVRQGNVEIVRFLLDHGAEPDRCNEFGEAPIDTATLNDADDIVTLLRDSTKRS